MRSRDRIAYDAERPSDAKSYRAQAWKTVPLERPVHPGAGPRDALAYHDETLHADGAKVARFCSMCGPEFCSMKIRQDVRDYAARQKEMEAGMAGMSAEFRERGGEVYLPADTLVAAEAEETVAVD